MSEIALVKYLFKKDWAPLEEVIDRHAKEFGDIYDVGSDQEVSQLMSTSSATLVIAAITNKDDLARVLGFLKSQRRLVKEANAKIAVVNYLNNKQVETALMKLGCQEVMDPSMKSKALKFKMDFWKKALSVGSNKSLEQSKQQASKEKAAQDARAAKERAAQDSEVKPITWTDALKHVDDMWISKSQQDVKKVLSRWMVKLMGPSPLVAQWSEVPGKRNLWQFVFKEGLRENFHMADGNWFFSGEQKPEFVWKENLWLITGQKFQLYYQDEGETHVRFRAVTQAIEVAKNSSYALSREKAIIETFDQEVLIKKGLIEDSKTELEIDEVSEGLLEQDIDGADKVETHYKGKTAHQLADAEPAKKKRDPFAEEELGGNYDGESGTDDLGPSHYDGKLEYGADGKKKDKRASAASDAFGDEDGNAGTDDVGLDKYKGRLEHAEQKRKSQLAGEAGTDDLGESHWSNLKKGEAAKKKARDEADDEFDDSDHLGRKKVHPLDAKRRQQEEELDLRPKRKATRGEDDAEGVDDAGGSSATKKKAAAKRPAGSDDIWDEGEEDEDDEQGGPRATRPKPRPERERPGFEEDAPAALRGKAKTDDLGEDHYASPEAKERAAKKKAAKARGEVFDDESDGEDEVAEAGKRDRPVKSRDTKKSEAGTDDLGAGYYSNKKRAQSPFEEDDEDEDEGAASRARKKSRSTSAFDDEDDDAEEQRQGLKSKGGTDDLGEGHYRSKGRKRVEEEIDEEDELDEVSAKTKRERPENVVEARDRKMRAIDDLLPDGDGADTDQETGPRRSEFDDAGADVSPIVRTKPRLVRSPEEEELEEDTPQERRSRERAHKELAAREAIPSITAEAQSDDGKPVVSSDVKITATLRTKAQPNVERIFALDDFFEDTAIISLGGAALVPGEALEITMVFDYMNRAKKINVDAVCVECDGDAEQFFATVKLEGTSLKIFEQFMLLFQLRQQHIHQFIKTAKGL